MPAQSSDSIRILGDLIRRRRTIKPNAFSDRPIPDRVITDLLENANWAPSHGKTEPWRFTIFSGAARQPLGAMLSRIYQEVTAPNEFKQAKADKLKLVPTLAPCVIAIGMYRQPSRRIPEIEEVQAVACAVQNLHLAATAHGLGGAWSSGKAICSALVRDAIGLGPDDQVLGLFYLGYPAGDWPDSKRGPVDQKVTRVDSEAALKALSEAVRESPTDEMHNSASELPG